MEKRRISLGRLLPWLALALACGCSLLFYALYGSHNIDADIASEMISAQLLNEEGSFTTLTDKWLYSTELRVVSPVPIYQLGLRLFSSWHAARTFSVAVILLLTVLSTLFMAREAGFGEGRPWLAAMLALPYSAQYAYIVLYGGYYSMHVVLSFVMMGLICRVARRGVGRSPAAMIALAAASLLGGVGGVRMMMMFVAPALLAGAVLAFTALKRSSGLRALSHTPQLRVLLATAMCAALTLAGYLYNARVLSRAYSFRTYDDVSLHKIYLEYYLSQLRGVIEEMGFRDGVPLFSLQGVSSLLTLAYFVLIVLSVWRLAHRFGSLSFAQRFFVLTGVLAVLVGMTFVILLMQYIPRYYTVGIMMLAAMPVLAWETEPCRAKLLRFFAFAALSALFFFQTSVSFRYDYKQGDVRYELAADWLLEHGYTQGFAGYWDANTLTEASDGQIEVWALKAWDYDWNSVELYDISQRADHLEHDPEGKVFLLMNEYEYGLKEPKIDEKYLVDFIGWSYYVYEFDSAEEMRAQFPGG